MSKALDQEVLDIAKWYNYHKAECTDVAKRTEFLEKTCDHLIWVLARVTMDLQKLEHRRPFDPDDMPSNIVLPMGIRLHDGLKSRS
jgi:hypothetical protein